MSRFRVIVFSSMPAIEPYRLLNRIEKEIPGAEIAGLLYESRPLRPILKRARGWVKNFSQAGYLGYVLRRIGSSVARCVLGVVQVLLKLAQASPVRHKDANWMSPIELSKICRGRNWPFLLTTDIHSAESLQFVVSQKPDLGIILGTRILKPALYDLPGHGSVNIHKRKLPDYRGGGPVGLWELLDNQTEIGVTIHRVEEKVDSGAVIRSTSIRIEPYDNIVSLALKADLVGEELLLETVRDFISGKIHEKPQGGWGKLFKSPKPGELYAYERKIACCRPTYQARRSRPLWKLLLRSSLYLWFVPLRNWRRRIRKKFPIVILYHHLISDRPHPLGQPTEGFLRHLRYIQQHYRVVSLEEAVRLLESGEVDRPTAVLTLDDGYDDNYLNLRAILRIKPTPVTLFVCSRLIEEGKPFPHDLRDNRAGFAPLTPTQLKRMAAEGVEIGSHTRTHFDCGTSARNVLENEIAGSQKDLESLLGRKVRYFSFPWGKQPNISPEALEIASLHYDRCCSAFGGANAPGERAPVLKRCGHPTSLWELELTLQGVLEFR